MNIRRRLASARFAAVLIAVFLAYVVISFIVPQSSHADLTLYEAWSAENPAIAAVTRVLGFDDVFSSPGFLVLIALLAVNMTLCTLDRLRARGRTGLRMPDRPPAGANRLEASVPVDDVMQALRDSCPAWWTSRHHEQERRAYVLFDRDAPGFWGSMALHVGMLLLLAAAVISGLTRFDGRMVLTVGETAPNSRDAYYSVPKEPLIGDPFDGSQITLDGLEYDYENGHVLQAHGWLTFDDGVNRRSAEAVVNRPARWNGMSYLMVRGGHSARIEVSSDEDQAFPDAFVRLGEPIEGGYGDEITLSDGRTLVIGSRADVSSPESAALEPLRLTDPGISVRVADSDERLALRPGESGSLGDLTVTLRDMTLWNDFTVRGDKGIPFAYTAFAIILLGSTMRITFDKGRMGCLIEPCGDGSTVWLWSTSESMVTRARDVIEGLAPDERNTA